MKKTLIILTFLYAINSIAQNRISFSFSPEVTQLQNQYTKEQFPITSKLNNYGNKWLMNFEHMFFLPSKDTIRGTITYSAPRYFLGIGIGRSVINYSYQDIVSKEYYKGDLKYVGLQLNLRYAYPLNRYYKAYGNLGAELSFLTKVSGDIVQWNSQIETSTISQSKQFYNPLVLNGFMEFGIDKVMKRGRIGNFRLDRWVHLFAGITVDRSFSSLTKKNNADTELVFEQNASEEKETSKFSLGLKLGFSYIFHKPDYLINRF